MNTRKELINNEIMRVFEAMQTVAVADERYEPMLQNLRSLLFMEMYILPWEENKLNTNRHEAVYIPQANPPATPNPALPEEPVLVEPPKEEPVPVSLNEALDFTKVRAICANSDKPLKPIIEKYVPKGKAAKLSNVPESAYEELVKEILSDAE